MIDKVISTRYPVDFKISLVDVRSVVAVYKDWRQRIRMQEIQVVITAAESLGNHCYSLAIGESSPHEILYDMVQGLDSEPTTT